jgi:large subunit ribosomal protein L28
MPVAERVFQEDFCWERPAMARQCEVCGKTGQIGNQIETRGKAKYLGGVGTKVTGISRRKFQPNLQNIKVELPSGEHKSMRVCTQCIRSGVVRKVVKQKPFQLPAVGKS